MIMNHFKKSLQNILQRRAQTNSNSLTTAAILEILWSTGNSPITKTKKKKIKKTKNKHPNNVDDIATNSPRHRKNSFTALH